MSREQASLGNRGQEIGLVVQGSTQEQCTLHMGQTSRESMCRS